MAVFGVPTVREDDALRAVRAAQELRDAVEIDVRIGVNTGGIVTGTGDTLVTGDAVNVAARLEQAAAPGEVLLGAGDVRPRPRRGRRGADAADRGEGQGRAAHRLPPSRGDRRRRRCAPLGRAARRPRSRSAGCSPTPGSAARSERTCSLFTILGNAGVGKSRLSAEFLAGLDATVVTGRCLSYGEGITYWPVVAASEGAARRLGGAERDDRRAARRGAGAGGRDRDRRTEAVRGGRGGAAAGGRVRRHPVGGADFSRPDRAHRRLVARRADPPALPGAPGAARAAPELGRGQAERHRRAARAALDRRDRRVDRRAARWQGPRSGRSASGSVPRPRGTRSSSSRCWRWSRSRPTR